MAVGDGYGVEVSLGWGKLNSLPREGIKRLQEEMGGVGEKAVDVAMGKPVVEEDGFGYGGVVEIRERELADTEVPVGVSGPLDLQVVAIVEGKLDVFALDLIDDGTVVDAVDGDLAAVALVEEAIVLFAEFCDVDGDNMEPVFVDVEVGEGLLVGWVDF